MRASITSWQACPICFIAYDKAQGRCPRHGNESHRRQPYDNPRGIYTEGFHGVVRIPSHICLRCGELLAECSCWDTDWA